MNYKKLYHKMYNVATQVIEILTQVQVECEDMYLEMVDKDKDAYELINMTEYKKHTKANLEIVEFGDIVTLKNEDIGLIHQVKIFPADNVKIEYEPGLVGPYTQTNSKIIYTANLPDDDSGIEYASEYAPFGESLLNKKIGDTVSIEMPDKTVEKHTILNIEKAKNKN